MSNTQVSYTASTGHVIGSGALASQGNSKLTLGGGVGTDSVLGIAADIAGVSDILSVIVESDQGTPQDLAVSITYLELY